MRALSNMISNQKHTLLQFILFQCITLNYEPFRCESNVIHLHAFYYLLMSSIVIPVSLNISRPRGRVEDRIQARLTRRKPKVRFLEPGTSQDQVNSLSAPNPSQERSGTIEILSTRQPENTRLLASILTTHAGTSLKYRIPNHQHSKARSCCLLSSGRRIHLQKQIIGAKESKCKMADAKLGGDCTGD